MFLTYYSNNIHHFKINLSKRWGIEATGAKQMPNALLYTSYMLRVINTTCHAEGLAVLLPCFWVYMHVGKCMLKLREELGDR